MSEAERRELQELRAKLAAYEAPGGWQTLLWRECNKVTGKEPRRISVRSGDGPYRTL